MGQVSSGTSPGRRRCHPGRFVPATNRVGGAMRRDRPYRALVVARINTWHPSDAAIAATDDQPGASGVSTSRRWPIRSAPSAKPDASAQSRMSSNGMSGCSLRAWSISARHQPHPANSAARGRRAASPDVAWRERPARRPDRARRQPDTDHRSWPPIIDICLTFKRLPAFSSTGIERQGTAMASDADDPEAAADRLEAALERIAQAAARGAMASAHTPAAPGTEEIAARIDGLIDRLRTALGSASRLNRRQGSLDGAGYRPHQRLRIYRRLPGRRGAASGGDGRRG